MEPNEQRRPYPISRAELARRAGRSRATITELCAGRLAPACLPLKRVDAAHPIVQAFARDVWHIDPSELIEPVARYHRRRPVLAPDGRYAISVTEFAARAEVDVAEVVEAVQDELAEALLPSGTIDLAHPAALAFMAGRPFRRDAQGEPIAPDINGAGFLAPAVAGADAIDRAHPVSRCLIARLTGRVLAA